ncbi:putative Heat stress transcription factor B-4b [Melia azedarach]|uniref:Heat stress transcription factor B-4b n=1 Tax=Melia azedarach TaxID=155640 RepID=A0ACC1YS57_MELAZ|nr:putative Heat stress transcription factor B-4b [Melia azedarach]
MHHTISQVFSSCFFFSQKFFNIHSKMASLVAENWACFNGDDNSKSVDVLKFDSALLTSLLEESNCEEYNDEQLNRVIQSLEAEINEQNGLECYDLDMEPELLLSDEEDGQNGLASMDFGWGDSMEQLLPSSPSEDMNWSNNYMEFDIEFENIGDYSEIYNSVPSLEEHGFSSLWLETYDAEGYN